MIHATRGVCKACDMVRVRDLRATAGARYQTMSSIMRQAYAAIPEQWAETFAGHRIA